MNNLSKSDQQFELNQVIVLTMERLSQVFKTLLWQHAKQELLSPIQIQFLMFIALDLRSSNCVTEIAREFNLTPPTVSDAVKSLEQKGLVERKVSENDRRRYYLNLTKKGKRVIRSLSNWQNPIMEHLKEFPLQVRETVLIFLLKFVESLKNGALLEEARTCLSCIYFEEDSRRSNNSSRYCLLRKVPLNISDLRLNCFNYKSSKIDRGKF
jgi:DNA-binding MarR family transcriptional regulator